MASPNGGAASASGEAAAAAAGAGRLGQFGIDTSAMQRRPGWRTSSSIVTTRPDGQRPAFHMKGATGSFYVDDDAMPAVIDAHVVHLGGVGLMDRGRNAELARRAQAGGVVTTADVFAGSPDDLPAVASVLPHTDDFMPSIEEAHVLTGRADLERTAEFFPERGVTCCVFTLGAEGAHYRYRDGTRSTVPAFQVDVRCTCGCGDAFDAGFAVALVRGMDPETSVRFAQATSALNATGLGSQAGVVDFDGSWNFVSRTPRKGRRAAWTRGDLRRRAAGVNRLSRPMRQDRPEQPFARCRPP